MSGARSDQSNVTLDGIDVNDAQFSYRLQRRVLRVTPESLQEFRVSTSNYTADLGRSSAAQVSLVTKSGTNNFNGAGYWSHRNTNWSSNEYFLKRSQLAQGLPSQAPKLDKHSFGGAVGGPIVRNRFFFFANYEGLREESESPLLRNVPSPTLRDGVLVYVCATASQCPGGTVQGFTNTPQHTGRQVRIDSGGNRHARSTRHRAKPRCLGPLQAVPDAQRSRARRHQLHGVPIRGADREPVQDLHDPPGLPRGRRREPPDVLPRCQAGRRDQRHAGVPRPGRRARSSTNGNFGYAIGYDSVVSRNIVNTFRYGLSKIDEATLGLQDASAVTFRFITDFDALIVDQRARGVHAQLRQRPSWLRGSHTLKAGTNLRFTRNPRFSNASSFHEGNLNPSWVTGTGRRYMPGGADLRRRRAARRCRQSPSGFASGYGDPWLTVLGVVSQPTANYNYDREGNPLPVGEPVRRKYAADEYEFYVQDSWRIRPNLTLTGGVRYSLYSPPWEVNGLQVAPTVSLGEWFDNVSRTCRPASLTAFCRRCSSISRARRTTGRASTTGTRTTSVRVSRRRGRRTPRAASSAG